MLSTHRYPVAVLLIPVKLLLRLRERGKHGNPPKLEHLLGTRGPCVVRLFRQARIPTSPTCIPWRRLERWAASFSTDMAATTNQEGA